MPIRKVLQGALWWTPKKVIRIIEKKNCHIILILLKGKPVAYSYFFILLSLSVFIKESSFKL